MWQCTNMRCVLFPCHPQSPRPGPVNDVTKMWWEKALGMATSDMAVKMVNNRLTSDCELMNVSQGSQRAFKIANDNRNTRINSFNRISEAERHATSFSVTCWMISTNVRSRWGMQGHFSTFLSSAVEHDNIVDKAKTSKVALCNLSSFSRDLKPSFNWRAAFSNRHPETRPHIGSKPKCDIIAVVITKMSRYLNRLISLRIKLSRRSHLSL